MFFLLIMLKSAVMNSSFECTNEDTSKNKINISVYKTIHKHLIHNYNSFTYFFNFFF